MQKIDELGGSVSAIEQEFMQREIARSAYAYQRKIESKEQIIVGQNAYTTEEHLQTPILKIDDSIRQLKSERLKQLRANRNAEKATSCLAEVRDRAISGENLMPVVLEAVTHHCTLGEIADELRGVFGEHK